MPLPFKRIAILAVQIVVSILVLYFLFSGIRFEETVRVLASVDLVLVVGSCFFFIMSSIAIGLALHVTLQSAGTSLPKLTSISASFGGQLLSDVTPAKSGYFATSVLLKEMKGVPMEKGLMSVMSMGAVNFFVKALISIIALIYFLNRFAMDATMTNALIFGITLLLIGGVGLTVLVWTNYLPNFVRRLSQLPLVGSLFKKLEWITEIFEKDQSLLKSSIKSNILLVLASVFISTIALYLLSHAVGMEQPLFQDLLFMGPLTAVFMYVPVTFAGLGIQEAAYVFLLTNIGAPYESALAFALLVRILFIATDLFGLPALVKTGTGLVSIFDRKPAADLPN